MSTATVEDYLKAIFALGRDDAPAGTTAIATRLGVSAGSVTGMVKRLAERGLVEHEPYRGALLTPAGRAEAVRLVRRHRLIELFLVQVLGFTWDEVHTEAERLEHAATDELVDRIEEFLGHPASDPHGAPIPEAGRPFREPAWPPLVEVAAGERAVLRQVSDADPEVLRYLATLNLFPGTEIRIMERAPVRGPIRIEVGDKEHHIGFELASELRVEPVRSPASGKPASRRRGSKEAANA